MAQVSRIPRDLPTPRSSVDSRRSTSDTVLQSFGAPTLEETAFTARHASRKDDYNKAVPQDTRPDPRSAPVARPAPSWDRPRNDSFSDRQRHSGPDRPPSGQPRRTDDDRFQEIERAQQHLQSLVDQFAKHRKTSSARSGYSANLAADEPTQSPVHLPSEAVYTAVLHSSSEFEDEQVDYFGPPY